MSDETDMTPAATRTATRTAPRQRRPLVMEKTRDGYAAARVEFEDRAQKWLRARPVRTVRMPESLPLVTSLGVPCRTCPAVVYRNGDDGHTVTWQRNPDQHWAAAVTATCKR